MAVTKKENWIVEYFAYPFFFPRNIAMFEMMLSKNNFKNAFGYIWGKIDTGEPYYINRVGLDRRTFWTVAKSIGLLDGYFRKRKMQKEKNKTFLQMIIRKIKKYILRECRYLLW